MTQLSHDDVRHIAKLARLELSDDEVATFSGQLTSILAYVDQLKEVDTSGVVPTAQVTGLVNALRPDELKAQVVDGDALVSTSPLPVVDRQIQTPSSVS